MENVINSEPISSSGRKLFFGLFIFPLMIAVGMAVLLCTVVLLTREAETPESLITAIKTGAPSKRWQKAFELSNELNQGRGLIRSSGVMNEIIHILNGHEEYDAKTRSYMAVALTRFDEPEATEALRATLRVETEAEVELYSLWALGQKQVREAVPDILPYLDRDEEDIRNMAIYVLGVLGDSRGVQPLSRLLNHEARDIRWNAALSLARLGNDAGYDVMVKMLDRETLAHYEGLEEGKIEQIMINAVKGLALLNHKESLPILKKIAAEDISLKVRKVALEALASAETE
ncbi:MAG: HEAT repeat domain-containing protein [Candidatus Omnitrophota bacterium]|nr:HEAT repeat domain-containing protein [Candidatus Omnitrophota bacterium]